MQGSDSALGTGIPLRPGSPENERQLSNQQATPRHRPTRLRRYLRWSVRILAAAIFSLLGIHSFVCWGTARYIHPLAEAPHRQAILVLGASVWRNGEPSHILEERLRAALELYRAGRSPKILVSGDHGQENYDEVSVMARYLEDRGVPASDIFMDHAGFRTLDSMYRAREVFGLDNVLVVSNPFHVPRAVFLGRCAGLEVDAVGADYGVPYSQTTIWRNNIREVLARILAFADVYLLRTRPRYLGDPVDMTGDGRVTRGR